MAFERTDTLHNVQKIVAEKLNISPEKVTETATIQDLGADSLDMVELIMKFEELFGIEIDDEDAEKLQNVAQVVDYIHERRKK